MKKIIKYSFLIFIFISTFLVGQNDCPIQKSFYESLNPTQQEDCLNFWKTCGLFNYDVFYQTPKKGLAFHEAAHTVMALLNGSTIQEVSIIPNYYFPNNKSYTFYGVMNLDESIYDEIKKHLAGYVAEVMTCKKADFGINEDLERACKLLFSITESFDEAKDLLNFLLEETKKDLLKNNILLTVLAKNLLEKKTLFWNDIQQILQQFPIVLATQDS